MSLPLRPSTLDPQPSTLHVTDATCLYCSCMCDDIALTVEGNQITHVENACPLGRAWFMEQRPANRPPCVVKGREVPLAEGIELAAELLTQARYPVIYGLGESTCEAQRIAVQIADWIGGNVDTATSFGHAPSIQAFQNVGKVTCTLGEIRNRSDLVIFWGANPAANQPRLFSRYTLDPPGMFVPKGRAGRTLVVIDIRRTPSAELADVFLQLKPAADFEALWILRALARGLELDAADAESATGVPLSAWHNLMERMKHSQYGALLFGMGLMRTGGRHLNCEALLALTRDMNDHTRFVCRSVRTRGNVTGADKVVSWQTGYPFCVNLSRGYPRYNPSEYSTSVTLARREADVAMIIGSDPIPDLSPSAEEHLRSIPRITIAATETPLTRGATVAFTTSTFGIHAGGTVHRMDEVPLYLRPVLWSPYPSDFDVLTQLEGRVRELLHRY